MNQNTWSAVIIAAALLGSAIIVSSGLKAFGGSIERTALSVANGTSVLRTAIPSKLWIDVGEIKVANGGGAGESFRIQTTNK